MEFDVKALTNTGAIDFQPSSTLAEIVQNVRTIMTTAQYSVPLDRLFGINPEMLDLPIPVAKARLSAEIVKVVQKYEPRVKVTAVLYDGDGLDGKLQPTVRLRLKEGIE